MNKRAQPLSDADRKFETVLHRMTEAKAVVIDTETSGLDWRKNFICGYVFTFGPRPDDSYYVPVRHRGANGNLGGVVGPEDPHGWDGRTTRQEEALLSALSTHTAGPVIGHNLAFDLRFLLATKRFGLGPWYEDTQINAPLLDEWQGKFSLEFCAEVAGVEAKKADRIKAHIRARFPDENIPKDKEMGWFYRLAGDDPVAVEYAEGDGTTTWQLRDWQMPQIAEQELSTVHKVESRLIPVLARMVNRGIKVDEERLAWLIGHIETELQKLRSHFWDGFSARSPEDVKRYLTDAGQTDWPLTPGRRLKDGTLKQQASFTEAWLETHEAGRLIIQVRKLDNLRDSFAVPMRDVHLHDGRVHTNFHQMRGDEFGTITGRLSSSDPNLQQVPKRNVELGRLFRSIFVPDYGLWGSVDYRQCEPLLLAYFSRAKVLVDGFRSDPPVDPHSAVTRATNPGWEKLSKDEFKAKRETGKRVNQTLITGGGKKVLVSKYKVPEDQIDKIWADYFAALPEIKDLQKDAAIKFRRRGYMISLLGRRSRLNNPNKSYMAVNRMLQCGNADIIKLKMCEVDDYLESLGRPDVEMLNNVHDALDYQFRPELEHVYKECQRIMQDFGPGRLIELDLPLRVDPGEGKNWAIATYGEEDQPKPLNKPVQGRKGSTTGRHHG